MYVRFSQKLTPMAFADTFLGSGVVLLGTGLTWVTYRWGAVWREAQD